MQIAFLPLSSILLLALPLSLVSCGGTKAAAPFDGGTDGDGSVAGVSFTIASTIASTGPGSIIQSCGLGADGGTTCTSTNSGQTVLVLLSNRADLTCSTLQQEISSGAVNLANLTYLEIQIVDQNANIAATTYTIQGYGGPPVLGATAQLSTSTAACSPGTQSVATEGTVTVTAVSATHVTGSYTAVFEGQGTLTGSFDVAMCALPNDGNVVEDAGAGPCH